VANVGVSRFVLMTSVCKITRAKMERVSDLAAIVIVKVYFIHDIEKVTERLKEMLTWCRIQNLVWSSFRNDYVTRYSIGAEGAGRLVGVLGQCSIRAHLDLVYNYIAGVEGAVRLVGAGAMSEAGQCVDGTRSR